jgi:Ca2+/Na+ antiporter
MCAVALVKGLSDPTEDMKKVGTSSVPRETFSVSLSVVAMMLLMLRGDIRSWLAFAVAVLALTYLNFRVREQHHGRE